jgi:hypothetical protein
MLDSHRGRLLLASAVTPALGKNGKVRSERCTQLSGNYFSSRLHERRRQIFYVHHIDDMGRRHIEEFASEKQARTCADGLFLANHTGVIVSESLYVPMMKKNQGFDDLPDEIRVVRSYED